MRAGTVACPPCAPIRHDHFSCFASYGCSVPSRRCGAPLHGAYEVTGVTSHRLSPSPSGIPPRKPVVADQSRRSGGSRAAVPQHWATGRRRLSVPSVRTRVVVSRGATFACARSSGPFAFRVPFVQARPKGRTEGDLLRAQQGSSEPYPSAALARTADSPASPGLVVVCTRSCEVVPR